MFDLVLRNCRLPNGSVGNNIAIAGGKIVEVTAHLNGDAYREIDCSDYMMSPPFVDAHFHMDTTMTYGMPRVNQTGTLFEGISIWKDLKRTIKQEDIVTRALKYCDLAVSKGLLSIRSHVDVSDERLLAVEALLDVRERVRPYMNLQLVAFPQDGLLRSDLALKNLNRALDLGVDVVGGIPHFERTYEDGIKSIDLLCSLASERGLRVDMHCDESDDPACNFVEALSYQALRLGLHDYVTASHLTSMHSMDNYYVTKLIQLIRESGISVVSNPLSNVVLQGRSDTYPKRRGITRVPELLDANITVAFGQDDVMDPWYFGGSADMLEVAYMGLHLCHMTDQKGIHNAYNAITYAPAKIIGLKDYGLEPGCQADFVLLQARGITEAFRLRAKRLLVIKNGQIISSQEPDMASLTLPERSADIYPTLI